MTSQTDTALAKHARRRVLLRSLLLVLLFAGGLWLLTVQLKSMANFYDEGLVLVNAERILNGEAPYRDFWTLYAPGYFYLVAGLFKLTGPDMLAARYLDIALRFLLTLEAYFLARRLTSRWVAFIPWAFVTLWLASIRFYSYPAFPATAATLLALLLFSRYLDGGRRGLAWLAGSGLAAGLTAVLRLDFGGYLAAGLALGVIVHELVRPGDDLTPRQRIAAIVRGGLALAAGAAVIALPMYLYVIAAAFLPTVWADLITFPATTFRAARHLPVPKLIPDFAGYSSSQWEDWLRLYLPLATYAAALILSAVWLARRKTVGVERLALAAFLIAASITGLGLVVKATSRYHELHALPTAIVAVILATALLYRLPAAWWRNPAFKIAFVGVALLLLSGAYILHFAVKFGDSLRFPSTGCYSELPRAGCIPTMQDEEMAIQYLQERTEPEEYVYVGTQRHDKIFANDLLFYFLSGRRSPTKYTELHPGLATTLPVQQAIAADLQAKDVRWVVTYRIWESNEPNTSAESSGVTYLDDYIREKYRSVTTLGNYEIWERKS
jgi:hypothetical protein